METSQMESGLALSSKGIANVVITDEGIDKLEGVPQALNKVFKSIMQKGTDYGTIPGTPKPSLWKPGAELLANWLKVVGHSIIDAKIEDYETPFFMYRVETRFYNQAGQFVGSGNGSANTGETRYAWRWVKENYIPKGIIKDELETKTEDGKTSYRIPTPKSEICGLQNTVLKIAKKRSFVDGMLSITGASRIFTQDVAEEEEEKVSAAKPVGSGTAKSDSVPTESKKSEDAFSAEYYLDRLQWYTAENGKNRPWKAGDKWGWCSATIGFGNPGVLEYAKPVVDAAQDDPRGFVEVGPEEISYDKDKGRLFRKKIGASIPIL